MTYDANPATLVRPDALHAVALYRMGGWGGMGPGVLPDPGGVNDQAVVLMEAFQEIAGAEAEYDRLRRGDGK